MNIVDFIEMRAKLGPRSIAVAYPGMAVSYAALVEAVDAVAVHLLDLRLTRSDAVAIHIGQPFHHLVVLLALAKLGVPSVSVRHAGDGAAAGLRVQAILTETYQDRSLGRIVIMEESWLNRPRGNAGAALKTVRPDPDDLCCIVLSSGTTGRPKCVGLTFGMLVERFMRAIMFADPGERVLLMIGFSSYGSLLVVMRTLWRGGLVTFAPQPEQGLQMVELLKLNTIVGVPVQVRDLVTLQGALPPIASLTSVNVGGGRTSQSLAAGIREHLCANVRLSYAATEFCVVAHGLASLAPGIEGAAGFVRPGVEIEAVDPEGRVLPPGQTGTLRLRSATAVRRYLVPTPEDETIFRDGWLYPGDLGSIREDGLLVVEGRAVETINRGGPKISPELIEEKLGQVAGIADAAVVGMPAPDGIDRIWLAIVARGPEDLDALSRACAKALVDWTPDRIVAVPSIPRNAMGKIQRDEVRRMLAGPDPVV